MGINGIPGGGATAPPLPRGGGAGGTYPGGVQFVADGLDAM